MDHHCPLCREKKFLVLYSQLPFYNGASLVICSHCSHVYTALDHEPETEKLYNDEVYKVVENRKSIFDKILNWEYKRVIRRINSLQSFKGSLLDFGSGKGKFASLAKNDGWNVKCVETSLPRAEYAKKNYGLDVNTNSYTSGKIFAIDFDVLTLFHVVEHLPDPKTLLTELIKNNLNQNALVVIEVPNIKSWQAKLSGKKWMHLDVPRHISHFSPKRLEKLANELGLFSLKTTYFSFHLGVLGMTDSFLKLFGYRKNIIYELKNKKSKMLIPGILVLVPFALLAESIAAMLNRGGIVRKYFINKPNTQPQ